MSVTGMLIDHLKEGLYNKNLPGTIKVWSTSTVNGIN